MATFLNIDALPTELQFTNLPFKDEKVIFTGEISQELNDGYNNSYKLAYTNIIKANGEILTDSIKFYFDVNKNAFIKILDCNFFKS